MEFFRSQGPLLDLICIKKHPQKFNYSMKSFGKVLKKIKERFNQFKTLIWKHLKCIKAWKTVFLIFFFSSDFKNIPAYIHCSPIRSKWTNVLKIYYCRMQKAANKWFKLLDFFLEPYTQAWFDAILDAYYANIVFHNIQLLINCKDHRWNFESSSFICICTGYF